jgi:serine/threonine-protein kinase
VLHPELASCDADRFIREIQVTARLQHPHILPVFEAGEADGGPSTLLWYTMPYVEGESLRQRLMREDQLPLADAVRIACEVAGALEYAHAKGVIHRDIKPENILLSRGHALVADFGIAKALTGDGEHLTHTGLAIGTPAYMSPEQATGNRHVDARSDIYSLGCVLYEMLAGEPPFTGHTARAIIAKHLTDPPPSIRRLRETTPAGVDRALSRALAKAPADRISSASEFATAISMPGDTPASARLGDRVWTLIRGHAAAFAIGTVASVGGAVFMLSDLGREPVSPGHPKLVVLPFDNLGPEQERYFVDGVTEEITSRLGGVAGLRVIAQSSASHYRKEQKTVRQIGRELGADYAVEGSVRWERGPPEVNRVRVQARLVRTSDGAQLWSEGYDAVLAGIFQVQSDIAEKVTEGLHITLLQPERQRLAVQPTSSLQAYDYFLQGQRHLDGWVERDLRIAVQMLERAIELDSRFALAHASLARAHAKLYWHYYDRTEARLAKAKEGAERALSLAPDLTEAHLAMGYYYYWGKLDYDRALQEFEIARKGEPSNSDLLQAIGSVERRRGRYASAVPNLEAAVELDPKSVEKAEGLAVTYYYMRRYEEAERALDRAINLGPDQYQLYGLKTLLYLSWRGDIARAAEVLKEASEGIPVQELVNQLVPYFGVSFFQIVDSVLSPEYRHALDHISPDPFGSDSSWYLLVRANWSLHRGLQSLARTYFDSVRVFLEAEVRADSTNAQARSGLGLAYAGLGQKSAAVREGERGKDLMPLSREALTAVDLIETLGQIYLMVGQPDRAIDQLEILLATPGPMSRYWLAVDPRWKSLRGNPRFEQLVEGTRPGELRAARPDLRLGDYTGRRGRGINEPSDEALLPRAGKAVGDPRRTSPEFWARLLESGPAHAGSVAAPRRWPATLHQSAPHMGELPFPSPPRLATGAVLQSEVR